MLEITQIRHVVLYNRVICYHCLVCACRNETFLKWRGNIVCALYYTAKCNVASLILLTANEMYSADHLQVFLNIELPLCGILKASWFMGALDAKSLNCCFAMFWGVKCSPPQHFVSIIYLVNCCHSLVCDMQTKCWHVKTLIKKLWRWLLDFFREPINWHASWQWSWDTNIWTNTMQLQQTVCEGQA